MKFHKLFCFMKLHTWSRDLGVEEVIQKAAYMDSPKGLHYFDTRTTDFLIKIDKDLYMPVLITFDSNKLIQ